MGEYKAKFGVKIDKTPRGYWSFGVCLSHADDETYLFINFFKWSISIGYMYDNAIEDDDWFLK